MIAVFLPRLHVAIRKNEYSREIESSPTRMGKEKNIAIANTRKTV